MPESGSELGTTGSFSLLRGFLKESKRRGAELVRGVNVEDVDLAFRLLTRALPEVLWLATADFGRIIYVNKAYQSVWGCSRDSLYASPQSFFDAIHPEDRPRVARRVEQQRAGKVTDVEFRVVRKDGSIRWLWERSFPIKGRTGDVLRVCGSALDITDRECLLKELHGAKAEYRTIFDTVPAAIVYKDSNNNILRANASAAAGVGYSIGELEGSSVFDLFPERAEQLYRDDQEVMGSGQPKLGIVYPLTIRSGQKRWIKTDKIPYRDENGNIIGVIALSSDITESKRLSEQRDDLMSAVAHDLRVPVIGSQRALELVLKGALGPLNQKQENLFKMMMSSHQRLLEMINNLIEVYRYETDGHPVMTRFNLAQVIRLCTEQLCGGHPDVDLKYILPRSLSFEGDESGIRRMIVNLVGNALKFTPKEGQIEIGLERRGPDEAYFWVKNTGSVISAEDRKRLFDRFWQGQAGKKFEAGTGLGLFICQQVVEAHHGKIACTSGPKKGTTFMVTLPLRQQIG